jgi:hypothetical protein
MSKTKKTKSTTPPWTVKGVQRETRTAVGKAAKRSGQTIGAYVDRVLLERAIADLKGSQLPARPEDMHDQLVDIKNALATLTQKVEVSASQKPRSWNPFKRS